MLIVCSICLLLESSLCAESFGGTLKWGRPGIDSRPASSTAKLPNNANRLRPRIVRETQVAQAAWIEEQGDFQNASSPHRSIVTERTSPIHGEPVSKPLAYDPFDEDDRLAQLPEDPFDDPFDDPANESIAESLDQDTADEALDEVEAALEDEIDRRTTESDLFEGEMEDSLEPEVPEFEPEDMLQDELEAEDPLSDDPEDEEDDLWQSEKDEWNTPDFDREEELTPEQLRERSEELQREREENEENCREELEKVASNRISSIDLSIRVDGDPGEDYPHECPVSHGTLQPRQWCEITYNWKAAAICHKPLYFEQVQLERYGHSWGPFVQPIMSGAHFFGSIPILPYKMGIRTPNECVYTLGYYRPGSCAPYMIDPIPFTWRAALFETGVATGISFAMP